MRAERGSGVCGKGDRHIPLFRNPNTLRTGKRERKLSLSRTGDRVCPIEYAAPAMSGYGRDVVKLESVKMESMRAATEGHSY
jgi:hypothetical protein